MCEDSAMPNFKADTSTDDSRDVYPRRLPDSLGSRSLSGRERTFLAPALKVSYGLLNFEPLAVPALVPN